MLRPVRSRDPRNHILWTALAEPRSAEAPALPGGAHRLSYAALAAAAAHGAAELDERFPPGSRVLVVAYDQMAVALGLLASLYSQCVPLLVDAQPGNDLDRIVRRWRVAGALGDRDLLDGVRETIATEAILGWIGARPPVPREPPAVHADDPALWTFTSGTTGDPRAVVHAHRGPRAAYEAFDNDILSLGPCDRTVSTAGLPFVYALGNNLLFPLLAGAAAILPVDLRLPTVLHELRRHEASVLVSGPWSLEAIARLGDRPGWGAALRQLRLVLSAGEPLAESVFQRWRSTFGQRPLDNLGCTEMFNSFLASTPAQARAGSLGGVVPGFEVRVGGAVPGPHRRGALSVRGASRAVGISSDVLEGRIEPVGEAWCETGDEVEVDGEGRFVYLGRLDDRFKVRGQFVRPAEVERQLLRLPGVRECMVAADVDERDLARVTVRIVVDPDCQPEDAFRQIRDEIRRAIPAAARTVRIEAAETLPRNARGKLARARAR
ncbi:MAG: AMP-binding protein [Deltaproteobacteria bacterium]|nr:AMP-binding protein [Deltaproteobacteria bacterium]